MPLQSVFPPSIPLRYQLLHDTLTCLLQSADLVFTALLLYFFYTRELYGYFNAVVTLVALASLFLTLHFSHLTRSSSLLLFLYTPFAWTAPFLFTLASYRLPPSLPDSLLPRLLPASFAAMAVPAGAVDGVKAYQIHSLRRHGAFHFHALVWTAPVSLVTLIYVAAHQHDTTWLPSAALLVQMAVLTSRLWMFAFSIHAPTLALLLLCIVADVLNLYASVLLLAASTASQPTYGVWFFSSYAHASLFNSVLLNKHFALFLLFAFTFLCLVAYGLLRQLAVRVPPSVWWLALVVLQYAFVVMSFVLLFVPVVALLFAVKCLWLVVLVYCLVLYEHWTAPVFYRRLYHFLTAQRTFAASTAGSTRAERVYAANQYFAQRCLTLYPPPACTTPAKRQWVALALHALTLKPSEFDAAALMRRADASAWVGCRRVLGAIHALLTQQPAELWYQRVGRLVGCLVFYVCLPCYALSVTWDVVWPIIAAVYLAAHGGCEDGGGLLAVIVGCVYGAVLLSAALLLPSFLRFHAVMDSVLRYELPRAQLLLERHQPDKDEQPALPCYPQPLEQAVCASKRDDDWRLLPFNVDGDTLNDWPHQMSALLYSRMLRARARAELRAGGMVEAVSDMVVSYLPAMEREREGREAEDGEWAKRRRQQQWQAMREPHSAAFAIPARHEEVQDEKEEGEQEEDDSTHNAARIELVIRSATEAAYATDAAEDSSYSGAQIELVIRSPPESPPASPPPAARSPTLSLTAYDRWRQGFRGSAAAQQPRLAEAEVEEGEGGPRFERMREEDEKDDGAARERLSERDEAELDRAAEEHVRRVRGLPPLAVVYGDAGVGNGRGSGSAKGRGSRLGGSFDETKHHRLLDIHEQE